MGSISFAKKFDLGMMSTLVVSISGPRRSYRPTPHTVHLQMDEIRTRFSAAPFHHPHSSTHHIGNGRWLCWFDEGC